MAGVSPFSRAIAHTHPQQLTWSRPCDRVRTLYAKRAGHIRRQNRPLCRLRVLESARAAATNEIVD